MERLGRRGLIFGGATIAAGGSVVLLILGTSMMWADHPLFVATPLWGKALLALIVLAALACLGNQAWLFLRYQWEARSLDPYITGDLHKPRLNNLSSRSLLGKRVAMVEKFHKSTGAVDLGTLSHFTEAHEDGRFVFIKFIQNSLILLGVFGTMASLGFALSGASDILQSAGDEGLGSLMGGMATALTTTMLAIVGFIGNSLSLTFLQKWQQQVLRGLDFITVTSLVPNEESDTADQAAGALIQEVRRLIEPLQKSQKDLLQLHQSALAAHDTLTKAYDKYLARVSGTHDQDRLVLDGILSLNQTLKDGFRLEEH